MTFLPAHIDAEYVRRACAGGRCKPHRAPPLSECTTFAVRRLPAGRIAFRRQVTPVAQLGAVGEFYLRPTYRRVPTSWLWERPAWRGYAGTEAPPPGIEFGVPPWRSLDGGLGALGLGGVEIPDRLTPLTEAQAAGALSTAYKRVTGVFPTQRILELLMAQTAQETGRWLRLHNYGFGNLKASASNAYYQGFRCWEVVNGQTVWYEADNPMCRFAAYLTPEDGAEQYIRLLQKRAHWWNGLQTGTVEGFVSGLTTVPKFFTGDAGVYARNMRQFISEYAGVAAEYAGQAAQFAGAHKYAAIGTAVGVFSLTFGSWYLYNAMQKKRKERSKTT